MMRISSWLSRYTESLEGKRVAITGSTGGIGRELTAYAASLGASLVLLDRNAARSEGHRQQLLSHFPDADIRCVPLDLEDLSAAERALGMLTDIDVFIHNAGAYRIERHLCDSGYDNVFQINFAAPYYMIRRLLPTLRERGGTVVVVGSIAHTYSKIDPSDVDFRLRTASSKVYGNAKRYLMFALYELFRDETDVMLAVTHPGITLTNITSHFPKPIFALIKHPMKWVFMPPKKAALSVLRGVFEATVYHEWIGPRWFRVWGYPKKSRLHTCKDDECQTIARLADEVYETCKKTVDLKK